VVSNKKSYLYNGVLCMRGEHRNNSPTATAFGLHQTGALNN